MRDLRYKGFTIRLRPERNVGIVGSIHGSGAELTLHSVSFHKRYFVRRFTRNQLRVRTSRDCAEAAVADCKKWIDERENLELAIQRVTMYDSKE